MALVSTINIDLASQTDILAATVSGTPVETITYDNSTKQVTFDARASILINFSEFLAFADQVNIFQTSILFNFSTVNASATTPFDKLTSIEYHDIGAGNWNLTVSPLAGDDVVSYEGTASSQKLVMNERFSSVTLSFPEWILFLQSFNHYRLSIKSF